MRGVVRLIALAARGRSRSKSCNPSPSGLIAMCGRFTLKTPTNVLIEEFGLDALPPLEPRYNIAPTQPVLAVRRAPDGGREGALLRWGLVPFWADDLAIGNRMINARAETVAVKPAYRNAFRLRRCLIVADGFYEWKVEGRVRQPYYFRLADDRPLAFAGLWERWEKRGDVVESCALIVTEANLQARKIHDRMPVILPRDTYDLWLDTAANQRQLTALLHPYDASGLVIYPVSRLVNKSANDLPECVVPIAPAP
jgi:putative SOS response-associated peptidase YedK